MVSKAERKDFSNPAIFPDPLVLVEPLAQPIYKALKAKKSRLATSTVWLFIRNSSPCSVITIIFTTTSYGICLVYGKYRALGQVVKRASGRLCRV